VYSVPRSQQDARGTHVNRLQEADSDIGSLEKLLPTLSDCRCLPEEGRRWSEVRAELIARKQDDYDWRGGRIPIYVYHDDDQLLHVSRDAYNLYFSENALGGRAFPSLARMEREIVEMSLALFGAPAGADGSFTSGGTESIFLALKTARDHFRTTRSRNLQPTIVAARTAHPAFDKAAHYLGLEVIRTGIGPDLRADVGQVRDAIDERTMMIVGSAPCYPYGVYDNIQRLAEIAQAHDAWMHVDACLGGFLAPFARDEGYPIPPFDFSVPGVTTLSADLHKYGFSAKGASLLLYRDGALKAHQRFHFDNWPRGTYATETFLGSRPGGSIASAWAVTQYLGRSGYRRLARKTMEAKQRLMRGIDAIEGLRVIAPTELSILLYRSVDPAVDIHAVADAMREFHWFVGQSREPPALHLALNAVHAPIIGQYLRDLSAAVEQVRRSGKVGVHDDSTY
jgi:sphinganine-1-phosphate aldolase